MYSKVVELIELYLVTDKQFLILFISFEENLT